MADNNSDRDVEANREKIEKETPDDEEALASPVSVTTETQSFAQHRTTKNSDKIISDEDNDTDKSDSDSSDSDEDPACDRKERKKRKTKRCQQVFRTYAPIAFKLALLVSYTVYFVFAMMCNFGSEPSIRILVFSCILYTYLLKKYACKIKAVQKWSEKVSESCSLKEKHKFYLKIAVYILVIACIVAGITIRAIASPYNLVSLAGLVGFVGLGYIGSAHRRKVQWYPVVSGVLLQLMIGITVLNVPLVYYLFDWLAERVNNILLAAYYGCEFVFGKDFKEHFFIFGVSAQILYFGALLGVMKYYGWVQWLTYKISTALQLVMRTQPAESIVAAANIFLGMLSAVLVVTPVLDLLTKAELHSILTSGMSTVAGATIGAYARFGISIKHIIIASVMSAPAALSMSRLLYPETKKTVVTKEMLQKLPKGENSNLFDAFSCGAMAALEVVVGVMVNMLVFVSALGFINSSLTWLADAVCVSSPVTFQSICAYLFWPFAFMMGADAADCMKVAELLGMKVFISEMVAYSSLGELMKNKQILDAYNGTLEVLEKDLYLVDTNTTLYGGVLLSDRSAVISTYALCGFSNFSAIGIMIGGLAALAPSRRRDVTSIAFRAMCTANIACFMTACVAGALYNPNV